MPKPRKYKFTLMELLIVVGIIGILAAMLLPALSLARKQAKQTSCMNNLKQISLAFIMYEGQFEAYPRADKGGNDYPDNVDTTSIQSLEEFKINQPGSAQNDLWQCPSSKYSPRGVAGSDMFLAYYTGSLPSYANYAIMSNWNTDTWNSNGNNYYKKSLSPSSSKDPVGPLVGDDVNDWTGAVNGASGNIMNGPHANESEWFEGGNQAFSDGHADWYGQSEYPIITDPCWYSGSNAYWWPEE